VVPRRGFVESSGLGCWYRGVFWVFVSSDPLLPCCGSFSTVSGPRLRLRPGLWLGAEPNQGDAYWRVLLRVPARVLCALTCAFEEYAPAPARDVRLGQMSCSDLWLMVV